jgi:hypothetical protein
MREFKYCIGQELSVISNDRNLTGMKVRIISRESDETANWYRVSSASIRVHLTFFEGQLE